MTLEKAFAELRCGLEYTPAKLRESEHYADAVALLERSLDAYRAGDKKIGAHLLQDFEAIVNPGVFAAYGARKGSS